MCLFCMCSVDRTLEPGPVETGTDAGVAVEEHPLVEVDSLNPDRGSFPTVLPVLCQIEIRDRYNRTEMVDTPERRRGCRRYAGIRAGRMNPPPRGGSGG